MRILVAPDKFKDSLGAREVAESIAAGLREVLPRATIDLIPIADGGEGTAAVICQAIGGEWVTCGAHDALGRAIEARYVWVREQALAVMEMSEAAGGRRIALADRDPFRATTFGVGEMLRDAIERGAEKVVLGLGGSVTNDGGFGMARALGFRFLDRNNGEVTGAVSDLLELERIALPEAFILPQVTAAADVRNPLLGERGATRAFGPQKGAAPDQLALLENALTRLANVVTRDLGRDFREEPGAGAAGGLGFGLMSFCAADIRPGFDVVAEILNLKAAIKRSDLVITGEGRLDSQTLEGKAPAGVASMARELGKPVHAIVGEVGDSSKAKELFDSIAVLVGGEISREAASANARGLLRDRARELAFTLSQKEATS